MMKSRFNQDFISSLENDFQKLDVRVEYHGNVIWAFPN